MAVSSAEVAAAMAVWAVVTAVEAADCCAGLAASTAVFSVTVAFSIFVWTEVTVGVSEIVVPVVGVPVWLGCCVDPDEGAVVVEDSGVGEDEVSVGVGLEVGEGEDWGSEVGLGALGEEELGVGSAVGVGVASAPELVLEV